MKKIELLDQKLLRNQGALKEIDRWASVMDWPNGWHYDLDIIWLVENLERHGIKAGMTVLDAGAGLGITQFILAARGYRVISLDYSERNIPARAAGIFDIRRAPAPPLEYQHQYQAHMKFVGKKRSIRGILRRIAGDPLAAALAVWDRRRKASRLASNLAEKRRDHSHFGHIEFVRASFHEIPLPDHSVDAVISVSAVEHSEKDIIGQAFAEMRRVTKPGGPILITTSATGESQDVFHEPTKGNCFSRASLLSLVGEECRCDFNYPEVEQGLLGSGLLWSRLDPYYYRWRSALFHNRKELRSLPYLPVGVRIQ